MEPNITLIETALSTAKLVGRYSSYKYGRRKEDDLLIRRKLILQLENMTNHLLNIMEDSDYDTRLEVQKILDLIDGCSNHIEIAATGHKYAFFTEQRSVSKKAQKELIRYDLELINHLDAAIEATIGLEKAVIRGEADTAIMGLRTIRQYITSFEGTFDNRLAVIKGLEKVV